MSEAENGRFTPKAVKVHAATGVEVRMAKAAKVRKAKAVTIFPTWSGKNAGRTVYCFCFRKGVAILEKKVRPLCLSSRQAICLRGRSRAFARLWRRVVRGKHIREAPLRGSVFRPSNIAN